MPRVGSWRIRGRGFATCKTTCPPDAYKREPLSQINELLGKTVRLQPPSSLQQIKDERKMKTFPLDHYAEIGTPIGNLASDSLADNFAESLSPTWEKQANSLLTDEALIEIEQGGIPDLRRVCFDLYNTFSKPADTYSAVQFIPLLKQLEALAPSEAKRFIQNPATKHVLVNNPLLKVVLLHWKPGTLSNIHGHPAGGCVFKVLKGRLREKRYAPDASQRLVSVSTLQSEGIAYIDDDMAYHAVGNPYSASAISLHVYTPGRK
jgi:predicted metal-dependent enzyme (double-stranded beta helix superfamily)